MLTRNQSIGFGLAQPAGLLLGALLAGLLTGCSSSTPPQPAVAKTTQSGYIAGAVAYREGDRQKAKDYLEQAVKQNPSHIMGHMLLGNIYREDHDYASAADQYEKVAELDPYTWTNHFNLGLMRHYTEELEAATTAYRKALALNPSDVKSNMYAGLCLAALGRASEGIPYSKRATELDRKSAEAWSNYGVVLDTARQLPAAEEAYKIAIELDPSRYETAMNQGANLIAQRKYDMAANVYRAVLARQDAPEIRERYARALLLGGKLDAARAEFETVLKRNSENFRAIAGLGDVAIAEYKQGKTLDESKRVNAVAYWKRSLAINPNQPRLTALVNDYAELKLGPR